MKKIIYSIAFLLLLQLSALSQTDFGLKAGLNISTATGDNSSYLSSLIAGHFGSLAKFHVAKGFNIQPESLLSFEGVKFSANGNSGTINSSYINIPVLAQFEAGSGFTLEAGPQLGLLLGANYRQTNGGSTSVKDQYKSTNFSLIIGSGFQPKGWAVGFDLRYALGLSNTNANTTLINHTSNWQIGLFFMLPKKK